MNKPKGFVVEMDPEHLWQILDERDRPNPHLVDLKLLGDQVEACTDPQAAIGGPVLTFNGKNLEATDAKLLLLRERFQRPIWSYVKLVGTGTIEGFLSAYRGRIVTKAELAAASDRAAESPIHTKFLYRFVRPLSDPEKDVFRQKLAPAIELGQSRGHEFGEVHFAEDGAVAILPASLRWEDREFASLALRGMFEFDEEICQILGFKGRRFFNPNRAKDNPSKTEL